MCSLGGQGDNRYRLHFLHDHCLEDSQGKDLPLILYFTVGYDGEDWVGKTMVVLPSLNSKVQFHPGAEPSIMLFQVYLLINT